MNSFIIISYFTLDTPYVKVAHEYLMPTVQKLNLKADIRGIFNLGSWQKNTSYKPKFIREMLDRHTEDVVFLDCDAEILKHPELFNNIPSEFNLAAYTLDKNSWYLNNYGEDNQELLSGTLFVRNCEESKRILDKWIAICETTSIWEQKVLQNVIKEENIPIYNLPISYCYIKSLPDGSKPNINCENPVITHNQVSRKLKKLIK